MWVLTSLTHTHTQNMMDRVRREEHQISSSLFLFSFYFFFLQGKIVWLPPSMSAWIVLSWKSSFVWPVQSTIYRYFVLCVHVFALLKPIFFAHHTHIRRRCENFIVACFRFYYIVRIISRRDSVWHLFVSHTKQNIEHCLCSIAGASIHFDRVWCWVCDITEN